MVVKLPFGCVPSPVTEGSIHHPAQQGGKPVNVPDDQAPKKISAKAIMADLKAEMTDPQLMEKYGLSFQGLQDLFAKLIDAKLATRAYFEKRAIKQAPAKPIEQGKASSCPYCGYESPNKFQKCPRCNQDTSDWLDTVELTKILSFE